MAAYGWYSDRPLSERLGQHPNRFNFYQLVRLLLLEQGASATELDRYVRFKANLDLAFPGHEVRRLEQADSADDQLPPADSLRSAVSVETGNFVLAGYMGPLPEPLMEQMLEQARQGNDAMVKFLDLFNHRINALRYQIKSMPRLALNVLPPEATPVAMMLSSLMGLSVQGTVPDMAEQLPLSRRCLLGLAGLLVNPRYSEPVVTRIISHFLEVPVRMESLVGTWRERPQDDLTQMGRANQRLGWESRLGSRAWMPAARIALYTGALPYRHFCQLLPALRHRTGAAHFKLVTLLHFLLSRRQDVWVQLEMQADTLPPARLTTQEWQQQEEQPAYWGLRLGQTAWLHGSSRVPRTARFLVEAFPLREQTA